MHLPGVVREPLILHTLGTTVALNCTGAGAEVVRAAVVAGWARCSPAEQQAPDAECLEVLLDDSPVAVAEALQRGAVAGTDLEQVLDSLSSQVTAAAIGRRAGALVMLHAAAVAHPVSGATALLVGESGAGKTTAAISLGRRLAYLSDETAGVTEGLEVLAHPKPLSTLVPGQSAKVQVSPDDLGLLTPTAPARVAGVFLLARDGAAATPVVEQVATLDALVALAAQTSYLRALPAPLHRLAAVVSAGGCFRVTYAEAADLAPVVTAHLESA